MNEKLKTLKEKLSGDLSAYQGIPFWSWNNEIEETELLRQIDDMKENGLGGFIIHARTGLKTEYLGEKWFSCVKACLEKAKIEGMRVWIYDENGWPSGFVGGKLLETEKYRARFLEYKICDELDPSAFCVYKKSGTAFERIYERQEKIKEYHTLYLGVSPANTDILSGEVTDEFIRLTHEKYYERFAESFGKELVGFFTDEPQYYRYATPYTHTAEKIYFDRYGEDIKDGLIHLFTRDESGYEFRIRYYSLLHELYCENYYKKLYTWCEKHGCQLSGHSFEESTISAQMFGSAGVMGSYEYEHVPTIDWLGRWCGGTEISPKQVGSVSAQLGKKRVLTETFACAGYDVTPWELKSIGEWQYFCGVNLLCHHLYPYSVSAQGKYDHPPVFSRHGNWDGKFKNFNDYFTRLGYIVGNTRENYDVGIIHPLKNAYLDYVFGAGEGVRPLDEDFYKLLDFLRKNGIQYHFIDEALLAKYGKVEDETLVVGECCYSTIILPKMVSLAGTTERLLSACKGKLWVEENPQFVDGKKRTVNLRSNITQEEIIENARIKFSCPDNRCLMTSRKGEIGEFIFIKNTYLEKDSVVQMQEVAEHYQKLNLETLQTENISNELFIKANDSVILFKNNFANPCRVEESEEKITSDFSLTGISENAFVMDYAQYSKDGETYSERLPVQGLFEILLRENYKGALYIRQTFALNEIMPLRFEMEKSALAYCRVNGQDLSLSQSTFDEYFVRADITPFVRTGENEIVYALQYRQHDGVSFALFDPLATESVRNCLYYDTHLENTYLFGNFVVEKDFSLSTRRGLPYLSDEIYKQGYPFFKGEITLSGSYHYDGDGERVLALDGRFLVADVLVNGQKTDMVMQTEKRITPYLQRGRNEITLVVRSGLRNFFGPHHFAHEVEPKCVNPYMFTMRGGWQNGKSKDYTDEYHFVPFGVREIRILTRKETSIPLNAT